MASGQLIVNLNADQVHHFIKTEQGKSGCQPAWLSKTTYYVIVLIISQLDAYSQESLKAERQSADLRVGPATTGC